MKKSSLKFALIGVLIVFAIVPVLILGVVGTFSIIGYTNNVRMGELSDVSLSKAGMVNTIFEGYQSGATALAKMNSVVSSAKNSNSDGLNELKAVSEKNSDIYDALILDSNGAVVASSLNKQTGTFENFNAENMPAVSGVLPWEKYGFDAFFVSHEIYADPDNKTGGLLGYVCLVISAQEDSSLMKVLGGSYLDGSAHLALIDNDGNALNSDGNGKVMKSTEVDSAISSNASEIFDKVKTSTSDKEASRSVFTKKSGKFALAAGSIPNVPSWRWVGVADTASFTAFSSKTTIIAWVIVIVSALLASAVGFIIVNRFIGKMHDMLKKMNNINFEEGFSSMRFDVKNDKSELGMIQDSFNGFLEEVNLNSQRYRTIASLSDNMLFEWDFHKESMYVSDNTLAKFDVNTEGATLSNGRFLDALMSPEDAERYKHDITKLLKTKDKFSAEYQLQAKSGANIWVSLSATCINDRLNEPLRVVGVLIDIDNEKKMELQLSERASYDFLSQLYNRSTFIRMLKSEIERRGYKKIGVMFIDVDDFKFINDRYGHTVGDEVIRYVADTIRKKVDDRGGFAGRFGGDEFVLCFTDQDDIENAEQIAMDLIDELYMGYTTPDGMLINVRASIGIAYCPEHTEDVNELLSFSDTAMYFVKKNGKTNYHVYVTEDSESGEYIDPEGF
ncbi:MAG: diguanylate cyclase [Oscillospiraceae bacterium]|nr:diguanylate cyclase [Oscillospiraceae bacterium]